MVLIAISSSVDAQIHSRSRRKGRPTRTTHVSRVKRQQSYQKQNKKVKTDNTTNNNDVRTDTIVYSKPIAKTKKKKDETNYKSVSEPMVARYLRGGFAKDKKLHLITNSNYATMHDNQKSEVLGKIAQEFAGYDITLYTSSQGRELWTTDGNNVKCLSKWNNDSLHIEDYLPLELKRNGLSKVFYYIGGTFSGSDGNSNGSLNLRAGTYLYKNMLDASFTLNVGYSSSNGESDFSGDMGLDSRAYLPLKIKNFNFSPYVGAGISWSYAPDSFFELRILAGGCWFVGTGSFDLGFQYGTKSDYSVTLGYTFRIPSQKKKNK